MQNSGGLSGGVSRGIGGDVPARFQILSRHGLRSLPANWLSRARRHLRDLPRDRAAAAIDFAKAGRERIKAVRYCARHGNAAARWLATRWTGHYHDRRSGARYSNRRSDGGDDAGCGAGGGEVRLIFFFYRERVGLAEIFASP